MSEPHQHAEQPSGATGAGAAAPPPRDGVTELVRWAAFSVVLVPVVLLHFGTSFTGAAGTALGLAAVTGVCRLLLRRSQRVAGRPPGTHRAVPTGRRHRAGPPVHRGGRHTRKKTPVD
ncbi:hypothetical protein [Streptomyces mutabilis]|uniref:Uncharacterized protein n=1 Tax=Streptomyces mutabilis TaxID=67332 RepID=A0A086N2L5_9ACTN|nr:hypothetical protein [Streptomyces mutabilis]KFG75383.1 hypothetical protein FM21_04365 [Streptomyces mutabilis]